MKPAPFRYFDPDSLAEALSLLNEYADDAKVLAGGQSLIPLLNMRLARPAVIVDLRRVAGLDYIRQENGHLAIGAMTRQRAAESAELVRTACPLLWQGITNIGHMPIRTRGTIGGSIAHADPAAELPTVLTALGGEVKVVGTAGERVVPTEDLFLTYLTTSLAANELVAEVRFPALPPRTGTAFVEVARRKGDFAIVGVAAAITLDAQGNCAAARLALNGVGGTSFKAAAAEQTLAGGTLDDGQLHAAAVAVAAAVEPGSDIHASAEFRTHLARVLTERALKQARDRARGGE